ncbi:MAG: DUF5666 domain-containing protein [Burkholderiaceae bacterium]
MSARLIGLLRQIGWLLPALWLAGCGQVPHGERAADPAAQACTHPSMTNPLGVGWAVPAHRAWVRRIRAALAARARHRYPAPTRGIGGTGQVASGGGLGGTGIVGVVTGFSSICVNGLRVTYEPDAPVWRDGRHADPGELAVGQVVALQAARQGGGLRAQRIEVLDAVVGPVAAINAKTGHLALVGQIAQAQEPGDLAGMAVGDWVRVSGLTRADGVIRATRVQRAAPGLAWLRGRVTQLSGVAFRVGATRIDGRRLKWLADLSEGQEVVLKGQWNGQVFDAEAGTLEPTKALIQGSRAVVLEGYVQRVKGSEVDLDYARLTLSQRLRVAGGQQGDLRVGQKVQVHGRLGADAVVEVDHLQFLREVRRGDSANRRADAKTSQDDAEAGERDDSDDSASESSRGSTAVRTDDSGRGRGRGRGRGDNGGSGSSGSGSSGQRIVWQRVVWQWVIWQRIVWQWVVWQRVVWQRIVWQRIVWQVVRWGVWWPVGPWGAEGVERRNHRLLREVLQAGGRT